jgi:DNA-binding SARP family transcriptional activator
MLFQEQIQAAYAKLHEQVETTRIVLLHPRSMYRSLLVAHLVNDPDSNTFYYSLGADDIGLRAFVDNFSREMAKQHPGFGRHLAQINPEIYQSLETNLDYLLEAFTAELAELSADHYYLILDEYDRSDSEDDIHAFIQRLADRLPEQCHIVLNSRTLPRLSWVAMVAKKQAALLLDDQVVEENFYQIRQADNADLHIAGFGPGMVKYHGKPIASWEGHLPRLLFFFALDKPIITRSEICDAFWPDLGLDQAVNVFHVTKRRLHKALGVDVLIHQDNYYQVDPTISVYYDVLDFVETLVKARSPKNNNLMRYWQHAADLYRAPFLSGHHDRWIEERRDAFRVGYVESMSALAEIWMAKNEEDQALRSYLRILEEDPAQQPIHVKLLRLYAQMGRNSEAVSHFNYTERYFREQGIEMDSELVQAYQSARS